MLKQAKDSFMEGFKGRKSSYKPIQNPEKSKVFKEEAIALAFSVAPPIHDCKNCGHPVLEGYLCSTCDHDNSDYADGSKFYYYPE